MNEQIRRNANILRNFYPPNDCFPDKIAEGMAKFKLGISANFATNRFPEPEVWLKIVGEELGLRYVQFVADLLNPFMPSYIIKDQIDRIKKNARKYRVQITSTFTGTFTRVNHVAHPDAKIRKFWLDWFKGFFAISVELGSESSGSHLGIMSVRDYNTPKRKKYIQKVVIESWQELARIAKKIGLKFLIFEPMSVPREFCSTIDETKEILDILNEKSVIPIKLCLDVDHGDKTSNNPKDSNPYVWLREFGCWAPYVHIKQSLSGAQFGHWPFTSYYNRKGIIKPLKVIEALEYSGADEVTFLLEISHKERYPFENKVIDDLKASVEYWRKYVSE